MKRKLTCLFCLCFVFVNCISSQPGNSSSQKKLVTFGDPFIMLHDGTYYAYGTSARDGFEVYTSQDLKYWEKHSQLVLHKKDTWADRWFWAPEVYEVNGKFYMYFSADEHISVAVGDSPYGPFIQPEKKPMLEGEKSIDNSLFIDEDGTPYLFFDRFNDGLNIWVAELTDDLLHIKPETMHPCIHVSQEWEEVWPRVNEGPFVIKHKGLYYMTYSGNSYESPYYGIGCAVAKDIFGEWVKYPDNPLLQMPGDLVGVGHSATFTDKEGILRIVFHAHAGKDKLHPRAMYISTVTFEEENGEERMKISLDYMVPYVK